MSFYNHKFFPRFFYKKPDGGKDSGVTGYFLLEWKIAFSVGILRFNKGSREAFHSHAFNAITWWLKGKVTEETLGSDWLQDFQPSLKPKITLRSKFHKIFAHETTYALTFRGPWVDTWNEFKNGRLIKLTHGRKEVT
jgi:hypothetical protein